MANQQAYGDLKVGKEDDVLAGQMQIDAKTQKLADADEENAKVKQHTEDTKASLFAGELAARAGWLRETMFDAILSFRWY